MKKLFLIFYFGLTVSNLLFSAERKEHAESSDGKVITSADVLAQAKIEQEVLLMPHMFDDQIIEYINQGGSLSTGDYLYRWPVLFWAIDALNYDLTELLIMRGADLNFKNSYLQSIFSILFSKYSHKNLDAIKKFLKLFKDQGADFNMLINGFQTPLGYAVINHLHEIAFFLLEECDVDVNVKNANDITVEDLICLFTIDHQVVERLQKLVQAKKSK